MIGRTAALVFFFFGLFHHAHAELEGIVHSINSLASVTAVGQVLVLSDDQKAQFASFEIDSAAALDPIWKEMRRELRGVSDAAAYQQWVARHRPTIRQVNYDLWQQACEILGDNDRIQQYYRLLLQQYLASGRDVLCIASVAGVDLTWEQFQELKSRFAENGKQLDALFAQQRRDIEARWLKPFLGEQDLQALLGEEWRWPEMDGVDGPSLSHPVHNIVTADVFAFLLTYPEVLDELAANDEQKNCVTATLRAAATQQATAGDRVRAAKTREESRALAQRREEAQKQASEALINQLHACLSPSQQKRLTQLALQYCLNEFEYASFFLIAGIDITGKERDLRQVLPDANQEIRFARGQASVNLNARAFDDVAGTDLRTGLGKLLINTNAPGGMLHASRQGQPNNRELYSDRYGQDATTVLRVPETLTTPPEIRIDWQSVEVPEGWTLAEATANLQERKWAALQIVDAFREWEEARNDLRKEMSQARRNGDDDRAKTLQAEYSQEYSGRIYFDVRRQFREAAEIAHDDLIEARRIVKQLGGDPGEVKDWRHEIR